MSEFERWICDVCRQSVLDVEHGRVEWLTAREPSSNGPHGKALQLVHKKYVSPLSASGSGCQPDKQQQFKMGYSVQGLPLSSFLGPNGLMLLLRMIHEEDVPQDEVLEIIKRLHIPGYEHARFYFKEAISARAFEPNTPEGFYHQYQIEATLRYAEERQQS